MISHRILRDKFFNEELASNPDLAPRLSKMWSDLRADPWMMEVVTQRGAGDYDLYDKCVLAQLLYALEHRLAGLLFVKLDAGPVADRLPMENQAALDKAPSPFQAWLEKDAEVGPIVADGFVSWSAPVLFRTGPTADVVVAPPACVPLEVGTAPSTKMALAGLSPAGSGIARWPYGQQQITVVVPSHFWERAAKTGSDQ